MLSELYILPILLFSVIVHEICHGYAALKLGDPTARDMGRLTLNPIPHIDLVGSIIVPLFSLLMAGQILIAWAKPVPVNPMNLSNYRRDNVIVSSVGPISNLMMAIACSIITIFLLKISPLVGGVSPKFIEFLLRMFSGGIYLNVMLGIFNLIPIPPLDGSHVLSAFLPDEAAETYSRVGFAGILLIIFLMRVPAFHEAFNATIQFFYAPLYQLVVSFA
ncbi:MAG TPA: site-2 protease family protein [Candidatus Acidoferrales bacterium]|nr:site-2 protease family protein [Candidatus Acidoferrales bacterium]